MLPSGHGESSRRRARRTWPSSSGPRGLEVVPVWAGVLRDGFGITDWLLMARAGSKASRSLCLAAPRGVSAAFALIVSRHPPGPSCGPCGRWDVLPLLRQRVLREVAQVALGRVAAPVDDEVRRFFTSPNVSTCHRLGGDFGWAMSKRGVAVDDAADQFGEPDRLAWASQVTLLRP